MGSANGDVFFSPANGSYTTGIYKNESVKPQADDKVDVNGLKTVAEARPSESSKLKPVKNNVTVKDASDAQIAGFGGEKDTYAIVNYTDAKGAKRQAVFTTADVVKNNLIEEHHSDYIAGQIGRASCRERV